MVGRALVFIGKQSRFCYSFGKVKTKNNINHNHNVLFNLKCVSLTLCTVNIHTLFSVSEGHLYMYVIAFGRSDKLNLLMTFNWIEQCSGHVIIFENLINEK